ncbi:hypothetical protein AB0B25_01650 [Nocardia sp. NPDC049190]|uniref:hypothetical protein n=1 Tax=Nocardia sp. NPDC049190 TaxID=3155650 RepID=UPI0033C84AA7
MLAAVFINARCGREHSIPTNELGVTRLRHITAEYPVAASGPVGAGAAGPMPALIR